MLSRSDSAAASLMLAADLASLLYTRHFIAFKSTNLERRCNRAGVQVLSPLDLSICLCRMAQVLPCVRTSAANMHSRSSTLSVQSATSVFGKKCPTRLFDTSVPLVTAFFTLLC